MKKLGQTKKNIYTKLLLASGLVLTFVVILSLGVFLWVKNGKLTDSKLTVLKSFSVPLATVNGKFVWSKEFAQELEINNQFSKIQTGQLTPKTPGAILDKIIAHEILKQQTREKNIQVSKVEIETQFSRETENFKQNGRQTLKEYLTSFGGSENYYKNSIIFPELELAGLKKWFFSQKDLNEKPYKTAEQILKLISEKVSFESLAKTYSQDSSTKAFGGDLGQATLEELLPEIAEEIKNLGVGEIKIVASRHGLHIIKLEGKVGEDLYQLRQIFLNGEDFESWQINETKKYKINKFVSF